MKLNKTVYKMSKDFGIALIALLCTAMLMMVNGQITLPF